MTHDCVIVPGIGALLAHRSPACYDEKARCWFPPVRAISFNPDLTRSDGLLAESLARRDGLSIDVAAAKVKSASESMRHELKTTGRLSFGSAGSLAMSVSGRMTFTPGDSVCLSPDLMWLPELALSIAKAEESGAGRRIAIEAERRRRSKRIWRTAAAAVCVAVFVALAWIVTNNISSLESIQFASVLPVENVTSSKSDGVFVGEISQAPAAVVLAKEPEAPEPENQLEGKFLLIVASLASQQEAMRFIEQYSDIRMDYVEANGKFRVYAAAGDTWAEAAAAAKRPDIAARFEATWVCEP